MKNQVITLGSFDFARAQIVKTELLASGIECFPEHEGALMSGVRSVVNIRIHEADAEKALRIIGNWQETMESLKDQLTKTQLTLKRILVAVDFSEHSLTTCLYALRVAKTFDAEIRLVHTYENPVINSSPYIEPVVYAAEPLNQLKILLTDGKHQMNLLKKELKLVWPEVRITSTMINQVPVEGIIEASEEFRPGLIFMGNHLHENIPDAMVTYVARKVSTRTNIPVFIVPEGAAKMGWQGMNKVLYAADLDDQDMICVTLLSELLKHEKVEIHCVHVSVGAINPVDQARFNLMKKEIYDLNLPLKNVIFKLILGDDVEKTLEYYLRANKIGLLALTPHKRNFLTRWLTPSLTNEIIKHSTIPVLLFHD